MTTRAQRQLLKKENNKQSEYLEPVPASEWPSNPKNMVGVYRSREFLVQVYQEENKIIRLSVNRTEMTDNGWSDKIEWEELQAIKNELGHGNQMAIEIYPRDKDTVNVANMRHLWVLPQPLNIGWVNRP